MSHGENEKLLRKIRILVAPLDWGLGHATRCIPLINELLSNNCEVWIAAEGKQEALLRLEFPDLPFLALEGYRIRYSRSGKDMPWKIILQVPRILSEIKSEHRWLKKMLRIHEFDAVISDNRFGLYHKKIPSVFITHQLTIKTGWGKWSEKILQYWNYTYINRFTECWIPDLGDENSLAGELSHPSNKPRCSLKYIGWLSRFEGRQENPAIPVETGNHLLIILSGPEPQRSILENIIIHELSIYSGTATVVRGLPIPSSVIPSFGGIKFYNHLPAMQLNEEMEKAGFVISRCGYSTVMELMKLGKKSILIPTPGQTEQEYIAFHLYSKKIAMIVTQNKFSLNTILNQAKKFDYKLPSFPGDQSLKTTIQDFLSRLKIHKG